MEEGIWESEGVEAETGGEGESMNPCGRVNGVVGMGEGAVGSTMAPPRSSENDLHSSPSPKKLESRVMGPRPPYLQLKTLSVETRGRRVVP